MDGAFPPGYYPTKSYNEGGLSKTTKKNFLAQNRGNITIWSAFAALVLYCYHLFSDGDFSFLLTFGAFVRGFAFAILIFKALGQKSVAGISVKTLQIYACVFAFRLSSILRYQGYLPFDRSGDWLYSTIEVVAILLAMIMIYLVKVTFKSTYEEKYDTFGFLSIPNELGSLYIIVPCAILGIVFHPNLNMNWVADVAWTIALYMEAFAILPQLFMFQKRGGGSVESSISHFIYALAFGSFLHVWFWLFSYHELGGNDEGEHIGFIVIFAQIGNIILMADFLYHYFKSIKNGVPLVLPSHGFYEV